MIGRSVIIWCLMVIVFFKSKRSLIFGCRDGLLLVEKATVASISAMQSEGMMLSGDLT